MKSISHNLTASIASGDVLDVRSFSIREALSSLFHVELVVHSTNHDIHFDAVLGQPASFTIHGAHRRFWSGICKHIEHVGGDEEGHSIFHIEIVPTLWLLTQRRNYRIFQQITEPDIARRILAEWGIDPLCKLSEPYRTRKFRVQYAESDYAFICRMLEDAGITFHFQEVDEETRLILSDAPQRREPRENPLPFKDDVSMVTGEYATRVHAGQQVRPGRYTMRDHDYRRPASYRLEATASDANSDVEHRLERFHYASGAFLFGVTKGETTPAADDKGKTRTDAVEAARLAQRRLEAKRANAKICSFETNALDVAPGVVLRIADHLRETLNAERYLVVEAFHEGDSFGRMLHRCTARSAEVPYRPPLSTSRPKMIGVESATVVGPPGEEIHTDEFGRVRVHFHWDRESNMDDNSSCWIHVSQPWAGTAFGGVNLPRVGQEVLVEFLGGDPDRPIIVGRVYTNLQKVPYRLPDGKAQSGWRTESTPGGGGFNEIKFDDTKGKEVVYMQAEKDRVRLTKNDERVTVGNNRAMTVGVNRSAQVGQNDATTVGSSHVVTVVPPDGAAGGSHTSTTMKDKLIVLDTGAGASITLSGATVKIVAKNICLSAEISLTASSAGGASVAGATSLSLASSGGDLSIDGGPNVYINHPKLVDAPIPNANPTMVG